MDEQTKMTTGAPQGTEDNEDLLYCGRRHWATFLPPFLLLIFAGLSIPSKGVKAWVIVGIALLWVVFVWMSFRASEFRLTRTRLVVVSGFPSRKSYPLPLSHVKTVDIYQPALGKMLDFGRVSILCKDGSRLHLKMVSGPHTLAKKISEFITAPGEEG